MRFWPFHNAVSAEAQDILHSLVAVSRNPAFFGAERAPDSLEGRFELLALHAALAMLRLRQDAPPALAQAFADRLFSYLDAGLREAGVGDLAVPKRMHRLAGDFYGRLNAYAAALNDPAELAAAISRNVFAQPAHPFAPALADYFMVQNRRLAAGPVAALSEPAAWPAAPFGI